MSTPRRRPLIVAAALALASCTTETPRVTDSAAAAARTAHATDTIAAAPGASTQWRVSATAFGPIVFGRTTAEVGRALREDITPPSARRDCAIITPRALPSGTRLMVVNDTVVRVDVRRGITATAAGVRIGDSEASVLAKYTGRVAVTPHKYTGPTGHYLTVTPADGGVARIVFETDGATVTQYRAGVLPAVEFVEGCA